ncbi:MAG: M28 family peptidase [Dehalococcoidia bacterium]
MILIFTAAVLLLVFFFIVTIWYVVTQPLVWLQVEPKVISKLDISPERLEEHVRKISEEFTPRSYQDVDNLNRVADYIRDNFAETDGRVTEQSYEIDGTVYRNVICSFGPRDGERIVIGAHYDAFGPYSGADDNASGVAGLLELAHALDRWSLPLRVDLVAYTLEEPPYFRSPDMGSAVHARSLKEQNVDVRLMIALEMIGYFADAEDSQAFPSPLLKLFYPRKGDFIAIVGATANARVTRQVRKAMMFNNDALRVYSINAPRFIPGIDFSDHLNYWSAGYQAVMVTDTAFYRNRSYHSQQDTADRLDYQRMAWTVDGVHIAILEIANAD